MTGKKWIHVFKTNVTTKKQIKKLGPKLDKLFPNAEWNFDLEDCDNIFRIVSDDNNAGHIAKKLRQLHINAIELD